VGAKGGNVKMVGTSGGGGVGMGVLKGLPPSKF
jgi:hypothetical protein